MHCFQGAMTTPCHLVYLENFKCYLEKFKWAEVRRYQKQAISGPQLLLMFLHVQCSERANRARKCSEDTCFVSQHSMNWLESAQEDAISRVSYEANTKHNKAIRSPGWFLPDSSRYGNYWILLVGLTRRRFCCFGGSCLVPLPDSNARQARHHLHSPCPSNSGCARNRKTKPTCSRIDQFNKDHVWWLKDASRRSRRTEGGRSWCLMTCETCQISELIYFCVSQLELESSEWMNQRCTGACGNLWDSCVGRDAVGVPLLVGTLYNKKSWTWGLPAVHHTCKLVDETDDVKQPSWSASNAILLSNKERTGHYDPLWLFKWMKSVSRIQVQSFKEIPDLALKGAPGCSRRNGKVFSSG